MATAQALIITTLAAGLGGGVTSNKQISPTRINCKAIMFRARASNAGNLRLAMATVSTTAQVTSLVAPTPDPLTDATSIVIPPGNAIVLDLSSDSNRRGEDYDLALYYVQGDNANDVLETVYEFIAPF